MDKIKKLHLHAESAKAIGSDKEAQAFATMVNQLLNKHRLELTDIEFETERKNEPVDSAEIPFWEHGDQFRGNKKAWREKSKRSEWTEKLAMVVAQAHSCRILVVDRSNRLFIVGTKTNRQITEYVLITLMRAAEKISWFEYMKFFYESKDRGDVTVARGFRHSWLIGFISRISERFAEEKAKMGSSGTALVRYDRAAADVADWISGNARDARRVPARSTHNQRRPNCRTQEGRRHESRGQRGDLGTPIGA